MTLPGHWAAPRVLVSMNGMLDTPMPDESCRAPVPAPSTCPPSAHCPQVMNEVEVMQAAGHHPNLVHFHGWYRDPQDGQLCLVMGFCEGGTLSRLLKVWGSVNMCGRDRAHDPQGRL